ncbi:hypothetical protein DV20_21335 [Amycolatopsis rifamycinica]|uniref:SH3b domain-containing protein n=2 Tax=Amycolatopsis rifamycinica TaxID=287986 RepID=A0A066TZI4_9PSEU|nr:hypothetical protein DV20_21335 [Amycolatopsis rifamycinica]
MKKAKALAGAAIAAGAMTLIPATADAAQTTAAASCYVTQGDWGMWCENIANIPAYSRATFDSQIVGRVISSFSFFNCWSAGAYNGRNSIWYWAQTDDTGAYGWISSVYVRTPVDPMRDSVNQMRPC